MEARANKTFSFWWVILPGVLLLLVIFPPLHFKPLKLATTGTAAVAKPPDAASFAEQFWNEKLLKSLNTATEASALVAALRKDSDAAQKAYSRSPGLGGTIYFFVSGVGRVVSVSSNSVSLNLTGGDVVEVVLQTGFVFGNALRDGTGLLSADDHPNSQEFNDIATELNQRVEKTVLPGLRKKASAGNTIQFCGCAEASSDGGDVLPLQVIPIQVEFK